MIKRIYWHIPGRVIVAQYAGRVTAADLDGSFEQIRQMVAADGQPPYVHLIGDSTARTELDPSLLKLSTVASITRMNEDKSMFGWVLAVDSNPNPVLQFILAAITQLTRSRYRMLPTLSEAFHFLADVDRTLPADMLLAEPTLSDPDA